MAKKKEEINLPIASTLNMPKQKVVDLLRKQIEQSDVLLQYQVPSHQRIEKLTSYPYYHLSLDIHIQIKL